MSGKKLPSSLVIVCKEKGEIDKSENICTYEHLRRLKRFQILSLSEKICNSKLKYYKIMTLFTFVPFVYLVPLRLYTQPIARVLTFSTDYCLVSIWCPCGHND